MEKWHTRLARKREELGWSKAEFARRVGLPVDTVYKYLDGKVKRPPSEDVIARLARAVGWTPAELMYGVSAPTPDRAGTPDPGREEPSTVRRILRVEWEDLGMWLSQANGVQSAQPTAAVKSMPVPDDDVSDEAFYTTAPDNANAPDIVEGDLLICDPRAATAPGHYVIARIEGRAEPIIAQYRIKSYANGAPADVALVYGDEAHYGRHETPADKVEIIGRITHRTSRLRPGNLPAGTNSR